MSFFYNIVEKYALDKASSTLPAIQFEDEPPFHFMQLYEATNRLVHYLSNKGVKPGARVVV